MYYNKYLKYKSKYMSLKKQNQTGGNMDSDSSITETTSEYSTDNINDQYQSILYEIAKYLKPNISHKFRDEYGMKQLSNQVIELNKVTFLADLYPNITNYYITDKIDGKRTILYLTNVNSYAVSDKLESLDIKVNDICILDTEKYENEYYIFDEIGRAHV